MERKRNTGLDLNQLRQFIAVAEELHFGRAASRLAMAQPPLSQSIQRLEAALGAKLLERSSRKVMLTAAGRVLLDEARQVLNHVELAERLTQRAAGGEMSQLRIGFTPTALLGILPGAVRAFRKRWPGVRLLLDDMQTRQQIAALRSGNLDIGLLVHHGEAFEGLSTRSLVRAPLVVAVPAAWPLARRKSVRLADLADQPLILTEPSASPGLYAAISAACREAGFVPNVVQNATMVYTIMSLVANEVGVGLLPATVRSMPSTRLALLDLQDAPADLYVDTVMAWLPAAVSPMRNAFISTMEHSSSSAR